MKKWLYYLLLIFFAGAAAYAGYQLFSGLWTYKKGTELYDSVKEAAVSESADRNAGGESTEENTSASDYSAYEAEGKLECFHTTLDYLLWPRYEVDFDLLKDLTEDIRGWIRIEDTHIDYPVVQHTDNSFYIRHGIDGEALNTGSIFIDYRVGTPFADENTVIYGHNQKNSAMFHDLLLYQDEEFALSHPYVVIDLPDGTEQTYRVFAAYLTPCDSSTYSMVFAGQDAYYSYLVTMKQNSLTDFRVNVSAQDTIITLSTCTNEADDNRMVVQAKLISSR